MNDICRKLYNVRYTYYLIFYAYHYHIKKLIITSRGRNNGQSF